MASMEKIAPECHSATSIEAEGNFDFEKEINKEQWEENRQRSNFAFRRE